MQQCAKAGADFAMVPDLLELRLSQLDVDTVGGIPVISLKQNAIQGFNGVFKRTIDLVLASTLLILGSPIILIAAIATKLDSPGPVFFGQVRVGKDGRLFKAWKIRSMKVNAEEELESLRQREDAAASDKIMIKLRDDPRRTRVGKFLRKTSLDELPQCWNVLRGEMSFVGPRPPVPREVLRYEDWHKARLQVVPGMTGLWQVSGRSFLDFEEMVMLDLYYIENWSPGLELKILLQTIPAVLTGRGAF
jgi:exopolysaccharide biosynthesis polyprenyl glycosylphosphotransferase